MSDKRERILAAAVAVIEDDGMSALTQPRVAARAELRQSHLTYYFPTRDDLVVAVAERVVAMRIESVRGAVDAADPTAALVRMLVDPRQTRLLTALVESADRDDRVRAVFHGLRDGMTPLADRMLTSLGKASTPVTRGLLHTTSTGIAVLALANGGAAFAGTAAAMLTALLATFAESEEDRA